MASYPQVELFPIDPAYQSASSAKSQSASILQSSTAGLITEPPQYHARSEEPRSISKFLAVFFQLLALLWVGGIGYLLYVNFKQHILGASAWCTFNTCFPQVWANDLKVPRALLVKFDRDTHNLLGDLQLAAKLAEIWFCLIAAWLVYLKTIQLAQSPQGLPIGYMLRHIEFANTLSLFDKLMWTTSAARRRHNGRHRLVSYLCLTGLLCVLCNLMGPAVAVLLLPSLQWIDTQPEVTAQYDSFSAGASPEPHGFAMTDAIRSRNLDWRRCVERRPMNDSFYVCSGVWANSLDAWFEAVFARQGGNTPVASAQNNISFTYNRTMIPTIQAGPEAATSTSYQEVLWVPNRQVLAALNDDLQFVKDMSMGKVPQNDIKLASRSSYNHTVSTIIHRVGPALGAMIGSWVRLNHTTDDAPFYDIELEDDKKVRCYKNYSLSDPSGCRGQCKNTTSSYTRCVRLERSKRAGFWIDQRYMTPYDSWGPWTRYDHFVSDAAFILDHKIPSYVAEAGFQQRCLEPHTDTTVACNWDALFNMNPKNAQLAGRTRSVNTIHITWDTSFGSTYNWRPSTVTLAIDFVAIQGVANYALDTSWISNPLMQLDFQPQITPSKHYKPDYQTVEIHPHWTLATWAADSSRAERIPNVNTSRNFTLDISRTAPARLQRYFELNVQNLSRYTTNDPSMMDWEEATTVVPVMQMLSIIDFKTIEVGPGDVLQPEKLSIKQYGSIQVWAYGITSRTGWLGAVVAGCGCLVVLYEVHVGLRDRREFRSLTEILISALQHNSSGEFDGLRKEKDVARVSFRLEDDYSSAGRLRFERVR